MIDDTYIYNKVHVQCRQIYVIWINTIYGLIVCLKDTRMLRPLHGLPATWQSKAVSSDFLNCLKQASIILCKPQARPRTSLRATTRKEFHIYPSTPFRRREILYDDVDWCTKPLNSTNILIRSELSSLRMPKRHPLNQTLHRMLTWSPWATWGMITDSWNERSYDWIWSFSRFGWRKMDKDDIRTQYDYYQTSSNMSFWMCLLCHVLWFSASEIVWAKLTSRWGGSFTPQSIEFLMRKTLQCKDPWKTQVEDLKNTSRFQDVSYCGSSSLQQPRVSNMAYWSKLAAHQECTITIHKGKNCNRTKSEETRGIAARGCQTQEVP